MSLCLLPVLHCSYACKDDSVPTNNEEFKKREQETCTVSCDVLVYGTRQRQAALPTMLVGGFGEKSVTAALRLALAVAQNGTVKEHAKLALSGILIPINDMLRNALTGESCFTLSSEDEHRFFFLNSYDSFFLCGLSLQYLEGDLFKFSASLALVRFCGPHIAAGEGNGLQSVRESIRVATNVLILPVDPNASTKQIETQESLKSECISALEALSKNASLWNSISKDALPSVVSYLHSSGEMGLASQCQRETRLAALRAVQRIIQLPSHTVSAAQAGLAEPVAHLIASNRRQKEETNEEDDDVLLRAMEVLHVIASNDEARREAQLLECGAVAAVCCALGDAATDKPEQPTDSRADVTFLGLEIVHAVLSDIERSLDAPLVLQSPAAQAFVEAVAYEPSFVRALCATLLMETNMVIPRATEDIPPIDIPALYGPQLVLVEEKCAGFKNTHQASNSLTFSVAVYCCALESSSADKFWSYFLLREASDSAETTECEKVAAAFCAHFLALLSDEESGPFTPLSPRKKQDYTTIFRPLVCHRLLDGLRKCLDESDDAPVLAPMYDNDSFELTLLKGFRVPQICLSFCGDSALLDPAFGMIKLMMSEYPEDIPPLFVDTKSTIISLFDMLNLESSEGIDSGLVEEIRRTIASMLGVLAEQGLLSEAVERLEIRSSAIAALAAACLAEDENCARSKYEDDEEMPSTSARMSSRCMQCMVELCAADSGSEGSSLKSMRLSSQEAEAIANKLGKKICHMVISRFLERAKLEQYELEEEELVTDAPDVRMLCAVSQHDKALEVLCSLGGLDALSLIAAEGEVSAILAMKKACKDDPSAVLKVDGHASVMELFSEEKTDAPWRCSDENMHVVEKSAFEFLTDLCMQSSKGMRAISGAEQCDPCISRAADIISALVPASSTQEPDDDVPEVADTADEESDEESDEPLDSAEKDEVIQEANTENAEESAGVSKEEKAVVVEDPSLEICAYSFLSQLVLSKKCRSIILKDSALMCATTTLASHCTSLDLQYAATSFLAKIARFVTGMDKNTVVSTSALADVFHSILKDSKNSTSSSGKRSKTGDVNKVSTSTGLSINLLHSMAVDGIEVVLDSVDADVQFALMKDISSRFPLLVHSVTVGRNVSSDADRSHAGLLAYNLSLIILLARGKDSVHDVLLNSDLVMSMIRLIQWHYDAKLSSQEKNDLHWKAAVTHCIQFLTFVSRNDETLTKAGMRLQQFVGATLMVSRPGKAPRKAPDFVTALKRAESDGGAASAVAARRILDRISLLE